MRGLKCSSLSERPQCKLHGRKTEKLYIILG